MRCPFLREAQVKYCRASAFRKMIVRMPGQPDNERCSSPDYANCPVAKQHHEERPSHSHCPFLHESLVQYCAATAVTKYIPYSEAVLSHCGTESHKYCELYLAVANPAQPGLGDSSVAATREGHDRASDCSVDGIHVPGRLWYSPNHMWLDVSADGTLHIGIDMFLARILGPVETLSFVTARGFSRPTVVITIHGVDLQMVFPNPIHIDKPNSYLRTSPSKVVGDPYTLGWLFEGREMKDEVPGTETTPRRGLITGRAAVSWIRDEVRRMNELVHSIVQLPDRQGKLLFADGGAYHHDLLRHLTRDEILNLFNEFFSPLASWRNRQ